MTPTLTLFDRAIGRSAFEVPCRVDVAHTYESLHAHVDLGDGTLVGPGDQVTVHGEPIEIAYGEHKIYDRTATVMRGGPIDRVWARIAGALEVTELYDLSFTSGSRL